MIAVVALIAAFQGDFVCLMRLPVNLFIRKSRSAFKQDNQCLKHKSEKKVVSLVRNALVSLNQERVVTLNRNQMVRLSEISTIPTLGRGRVGFSELFNQSISCIYHSPAWRRNPSPPLHSQPHPSLWEGVLAASQSSEHLW